MQNAEWLKKTLMVAVFILVTGGGVALLVGASGCGADADSGQDHSAASSANAGVASRATTPLGAGKSMPTGCCGCCSGMDMSGHDHSAASSTATTSDANAPATHAQTNCPVMGGRINKAIFVDYQGKRVYFCCGACPAEFRKDPAKYIKAMEDQGVVLDKTPAAAPAGK
jgi:YHS domain-containing protein